MGILQYFAIDKIDSSSINNMPTASANDVLANVLGIVYTVGGITAVITIIIAGYMYTISGGSPAEVEKSKNAILYAVIGLIIIGSAFVITQFVIGRF